MKREFFTIAKAENFETAKAVLYAAKKFIHVQWKCAIEITAEGEIKIEKYQLTAAQIETLGAALNALIKLNSLK